VPKMYENVTIAITHTLIYRTYGHREEQRDDMDGGIFWLSFIPSTKCCKKMRIGYKVLG